jgi:tetratricopeptide (TPR) repeat protein
MMSSGLDFKEDYGSMFSWPAKAYYGKDVNATILNPPKVNEPGEVYSYKGGDTQLLGMILEKATGKRVATYASEKLWGRIGAESDAFWSLDVEDGMEKVSCCFYATARDFARFGKLYMNYGKYEWALSEFETAVKVAHSRGKEQDIDTLLLLGQCEDVLGNLDLAISIYESVLLRDPTNAVAHTAIGLILLGVGNSNYGAINACGLNQEEALSHLQLALKTNAGMKPAEEALAFCRKEFAEAKIWRQHLSSSAAKSSSTDITDSNAIIDTIKRIVGSIKDPVLAILRVVESTYNNNILRFLKRGKLTYNKSLLELILTILLIH